MKLIEFTARHKKLGTSQTFHYHSEAELYRHNPDYVEARAVGISEHSR